jgi:hypothetical protein
MSISRLDISSRRWGSSPNWIHGQSAETHWFPGGMIHRPPENQKNDVSTSWHNKNEVPPCWLEYGRIHPSQTIGYGRSFPTLSLRERRLRATLDTIMAASSSHTWRATTGILLCFRIRLRGFPNILGKL